MIPEIQISYRPDQNSLSEIRSAIHAFNFLYSLYDKDTILLKEEAYSLYLNKGQKVLGWHKLSSGGIHGTVIDLKLVLGIALNTAASGIILCHNHPSGRLKPSTQDKEITLKLRDAARLMDIQLLDHLIIHPSGFFSFVEEGII